MDFRITPLLAVLAATPLVVGTGCTGDEGSTATNPSGTETDPSTTEPTSNTNSESNTNTEGTTEGPTTTPTGGMTESSTGNTNTNTNTNTDTDPSTTDPSATDPSTTDPSTTDPSTTDPSTTDPSSTGTDSSSSGGMSSSSSGGVEPPPDADMDGIPDDDDPFPDDADLPGVGEPFKIYAHTNNTLFTMDPTDPYAITQIGQFSFDQSQGSITDIALDRWGVLYGITFNDLFVIDPSNANAYYLADIPQTANGLTMVPPGVLEMDDDTLIAIANSGIWYQVTQNGNQAQFMNIGSYGGGYGNAGDVFSIQGVGTYGATNKQGVNNGNVIVVANPMNGMVQSDLATTVGYTTLWGLAGWAGEIFGFNSSGAVVSIDPDNGDVNLLTNTPHSWWGAGVRTVIPQ